MGMYTEFHFNVELKQDVPNEVLEILRYMVGDIEDKPSSLPSHPLFSTNRWCFMLQCDSYYFSADTRSTLRADTIGRCYYLCIRCNLKNYDGEIEKFVDWIKPYIAEHHGSFLGFSRYEEDEHPTLIYND